MYSSNEMLLGNNLYLKRNIMIIYIYIQVQYIHSSMNLNILSGELRMNKDNKTSI